MKHKSSKYFRNNKLINRKLQEHPAKAVDEKQAYMEFLDSVYATTNKNVEEIVIQQIKNNV